MDHNLNNLLSEATHYLAAYLAEVLPSISDDWWEGAVVDKLSFQQRQRVKQKGITSLSLLDLAALLRVLDQNWYQISERMRLPSEARHFVKEMRTVRNRWAHVSEEGFSVDDVYRDLDTLQRFAAVIEAEEAFIQEIRAAKTSLLEGDLASISEAPISEGQATQGKGAQAAEFEPGQIVFLKSNPEMKGAVISVIPGEPENRYDVFVDGKTQIFYASQIQAEDRKDKDAVVLPCHKFHSYLTALQIQHPGLSTLYSLNAARVDFIPYQFRPVLKFIRSDRPRLLIADGETSTIITALVKETTNGQPIAEETVSWSTTLGIITGQVDTDQFGISATQLISSPFAGLANIEASFGAGLGDSLEIEFIPLAIDAIEFFISST